MKVLVVCSYKDKLPNNMAPFVWEQAQALSERGIEIQFYLAKGKGFSGYLKELPNLKNTIREFRPDIIHAHFGLCGLLSNLQRRVPVVTTYHGSDINNPKVRWLSKVAIRLSKYNIFVSQRQLKLVNPGKHYDMIPCGIDLEDYPEFDKKVAREKMGLDLEKKYVLFAGAFDNPVKNYPLARAAIDMIPEAELLELKGYSREQVALLMNAVDCLLITSHTEGSPQVIKEAMACGCPIVSVDVGDVKEVLSCVTGCSISDQTVSSLSKALKKALALDKRTNGRKLIKDLCLTNTVICSRLIQIYQSII